MNVFVTILAGVTVFVIGQILVKLWIEPVHDLRKTIGAISHALIERANVIHNPGLPTKESMQETSRELRKLSSQLEAHLFLIPAYRKTAFVFGLPAFDQIRTASSNLIGLSNSIFAVSTNETNIYKEISKREEIICDSLGIFMAAENRWPDDA